MRVAVIRGEYLTKWEMQSYEPMFNRAESERPTQSFKRYVHRHADIFLAMSQKAADALRMEGVDGRRIRVHFPGIDLRRFRPLPRPGSMDGLPWRRDNALRVLLVGSITPARGIWEFLMAAAELAKMPALHGRVEFALVGKADGDGLLTRMINTLGVQDVVTHQSAVAYAEMPRLYASADLFVLPSIPAPVWEEQFGMVLAESMACGRAVVSTRSGAIPEVVGDAGLLVPPYDHLGLADAIAELLLNEEKRNRLGDYAATRARDLFDCQRFASDMYTLYTELLA